MPTVPLTITIRDYKYNANITLPTEVVVPILYLVYVTEEQKYTLTLIHD